MAKRITLSEQYDRQIARIAKRLDQLQEEGYNIIGDWQPQKPKRVTRSTIESLRAVTPSALRRASDKNYNINIGKSPTRAVQRAKKKDLRKIPPSARPPKPTHPTSRLDLLPPRRKPTDKANAPEGDSDDKIWDRAKSIINTVYAVLREAEMSGDLFVQIKGATAAGLFTQALRDYGDVVVAQRLEAMPEDYVTAFRGYIFDSKENVYGARYYEIFYALFGEDMGVDNISNPTETEEGTDEPQPQQIITGVVGLRYYPETGVLIDNNGTIKYKRVPGGLWEDVETGQRYTMGELQNGS